MIISGLAERRRNLLMIIPNIFIERDLALTGFKERV
jgi:hypothetical protein